MFLILFVVIGPTPLDLQTVEWLAHHDVPLKPVATKADKVKPSRRGARKAELAKGLGVAPGDVIWTSAAKGQGVPELRAEISTALRLNP